MVFAIAANTETARLDRGEAQTDGLAEGSSVDMRNSVHIADVPVRVVETLSGDVPIRVLGIVGGEPAAIKK